MMNRKSLIEAIQNVPAWIQTIVVKGYALTVLIAAVLFLIGQTILTFRQDDVWSEVAHYSMLCLVVLFLLAVIGYGVTRAMLLNNPEGHIGDTDIRECKEAQMVINGKMLTDAQSATVRVAIESLDQSLQVYGLGHDTHGVAMRKAYLDRIREIRSALYK